MKTPTPKKTKATPNTLSLQWKEAERKAAEAKERVHRAKDRLRSSRKALKLARKEAKSKRRSAKATRKAWERMSEKKRAPTGKKPAGKKDARKSVQAKAKTKPSSTKSSSRARGRAHPSPALVGKRSSRVSDQLAAGRDIPAAPQTLAPARTEVAAWGGNQPQG